MARWKGREKEVGKDGKDANGTILERTEGPVAEMVFWI